MKRLVLLAVLYGGACGAATDDRPRTLQYITDTILAPTCAVAECHSAFKREVGDQFDTLEATRLSIVANDLVNIGEPMSSTLYRSITVGASRPGRNTPVRMPFDAPMPDADVQLIGDWIQEGAHGAQCIANADGNGCASTPTPAGVVYRVVKCTPDGDIGADVMICPGSQVCRYESGNGQCVTPRS